jgi:hypothetical protein
VRHHAGSEHPVQTVAIGTAPAEELIARKTGGLITEEECSELAEFLQLEPILIMAKARARQRLQPA